VTSVIDYQSIVVTSRLAYINYSITPFYDSQLKNIDNYYLPENFDIEEQVGSDIVGGPMKSESAQKLLYISADCPTNNDPRWDEECFQAVVIPYPDKHQVKIHVADPLAFKQEQNNAFIFNAAGDIFAQIGNKFYVFHKSGKIICEFMTGFDPEAEITILAIAPNGQYLALQLDDNERNVELVKIVKLKSQGDQKQYGFRKHNTFNLDPLFELVPDWLRKTVCVDNGGDAHFFLIGGP